jgi:hypothetical protein
MTTLRLTAQPKYTSFNFTKSHKLGFRVCEPIQRGEHKGSCLLKGNVSGKPETVTHAEKLI